MTGTKWRMLGSIKMGTENVYSQEQATKDIAACKALHAEQVEIYGADAVGDLPELDKHPVHIALVAERDGKVVQIFYAERILEMCMIGCDGAALAHLKKARKGLIHKFQERGYRLLRTFIPKGAPIGIAKELKRTGFRPQCEMYEHFLLDMRTKENTRG